MFKKILIGIFIFSCFGFGTEFGQMGYTAMSVGNAGVALTNTPFGIYYNPALVSRSTKSRFGYSFSFNIAEKNLLKLANIDINKLNALSNDVQSLFTVTSKSTNTLTSSAIIQANTISALSNAGNTSYFNSVINQLIGNNNNNIESFVKEKFQVSNIDDFKTKITSNDSNTFNEFKGLLKEANSKVGNNELLNSIIDGLSPENVNGLVSLVKDNKIDTKNISEIIKTLDGISLTSSNNLNINEVLTDINTIKNTLDNNNIQINITSGLVYQSHLVNYFDNNSGGFAIGLFINSYVNASASFDNTHNRIILNNSKDSYLEILTKDNTLNINTNNINKNEFDNYSIFSDSAKHMINAAGLVLIEIPVAYSHTINFNKGGLLSIGASFKYMQSFGYFVHNEGNFNNVFKTKLPNTPSIDYNFGIDIGLLYSPIHSLNIGFVAKNINFPKFSLSSTHKITIKPQLRAGLSYNLGLATFVFDADIIKNNTLTYNNFSQMIGGGMILDFKFMDLRLGSMYNLRDTLHIGPIITAGFNLFGFIDFTIQSNFHTTQFKNIHIPEYFTINIGGNIAF